MDSTILFYQLLIVLPPHPHPSPPAQRMAWLIRLSSESTADSSFLNSSPFLSHHPLQSPVGDVAETKLVPVWHFLIPTVIVPSLTEQYLEDEHTHLLKVQFSQSLFHSFYKYFLNFYSALGTNWVKIKS